MRTAIALLCLCLATPAAWGEEVPAPPPAPKKPAAKAAPSEARDAARIGRALLAREEAVRRKAIAELLARIERGGDLTTFFRSMARATADWADRRERLTEVWVEQAIHGSARERAEAARLLHALGPQAVQRLAEALRHQDGVRPTKHARPQAPSSSVPAPGTGGEVPPTENEIVCCKPGIYDIVFLLKRGMNHVEIRSLLQKVPDAVEVKRVNDGAYVVTATAEGHQRLQDHLAKLRKQRSGQVYRLEKKKGDQAAKHEGRWIVVPTVYRVPRAVITAPRKPKAAKGSYASAGSIPGGIDPQVTAVQTGTSLDAIMWMRYLQRGPHATKGAKAEGANAVAAGSNGHFFAGRTRTFRKGLVSRKDGSWAVEMGTLRLGVDLDIALVPEKEQLIVALVAARTEIVEPMPVDTMTSPAGDPFELDRPDWSRTRTRTTFRLPATGGAAFLSLGGLGSTPEDHVVVVLRVLPAEPTTQKAR